MRTTGSDQTRLGYEYDFRSKWLTLVPSVQAATHNFFGARRCARKPAGVFSPSAAGGGRTCTRMEPGFDPNDYAQFGAGYRDASGNTISINAIHDIRLGTGQTNTHFIVQGVICRMSGD